MSQEQIEELVALAATSSKNCFNLLKYGSNYQLKPSHIDRLIQGVDSVREAELLLEIGDCIWQHQLPTENKIGLSQTHVDFLLQIISQYSVKSRQILSDGMYYALTQEQFEKLFLSTLYDSFESSELLKLGCKSPLSPEREQALYESALRFAPAAENLLKTYSKFAPEKEQIDKLIAVAVKNPHSAAEILMYGSHERYSQEQAGMLWQSASQDADVAARLIFGVPRCIDDENFSNEIYYDKPNFVPEKAQIDALYESITNTEFLSNSATSYMLGFCDLSFVDLDPYFAPSQAQLEALKEALRRTG